MTHYERSYKNMNRKQADEKAILDIFEWFSNKPILVADLVQLAVCIEYEIPTRNQNGTTSVSTIQSLNMTFGFGGVSGYPFHAFCRRYCPNKYREWMTSGPDAVELDEENFSIPDELVEEYNEYKRVNGLDGIKVETIQEWLKVREG